MMLNNKRSNMSTKKPNAPTITANEKTLCCLDDMNNLFFLSG